MMENYIVYHLHSDYSSCITNIDSVTKVKMYVNKAKECGMKALAFSEHGSTLNWYEKKSAIEEAGMKYIHAIEAYITEKLVWLDEEGNEKKVRDNYHCILIAKNYDGFKEINRLVTKSFNREDGHFYYTPRITIDELENTSDNIIVTSACLASIFGKGNEAIQKRYLDFFVKNRHRCYLEIQHHNVEKQKEYNKKLYQMHLDYDISLVAGTDTHSLNKELADARLILQRAKKTYFDEEEGWDLTFKTYDELIEAYELQNSLPMDVVKEAIYNTNLIADRVEEFKIDTSPKYPNLFPNAYDELRRVSYEAIDKHPYALKNHSREELEERIEMELDGFHKTNMESFMLFKKLINDWQHKNGIWSGPSRGSVSGSMIAYLLGITEMDSMKFDLNFFRFVNPNRVSNADVDEDLYEEDRDRVREFLLTFDKINSSEIVSFGTIAIKGAIRDVGRALEMPLQEVNEICSKIEQDDKKKDFVPDKLRNQYPELFRWVDLLNGVITSVGTHPAGVLCSTLDITEEIGLISLSTTKYPVSSVDMYGLDAMMYTKMDELGLDNIGIINKTCQLAGIERINPDNINLEDWNVWKSIRDDTTCIFQWESSMASQLVKNLFSDNTISKIKKEIPDISMLKLFSFGNALIRPCGASIRDEIAKGNFHRTGIEDLDNLLKQELFVCIIQEDIMKFVMQFCGYDLGQADYVRKCVAKDSSVLMADGSAKLIQDIIVGDRVQSYNNGYYSGQNVTNVFYNGKKEVYKICTKNGFELKSTKDHKYLTQRGWVELQDITEDDYLFVPEKINIDSNKRISTSQSFNYILPSECKKEIKVKDIKYIGVEDVYDIEVENTHNFVANGITVHNCIAKKKGTEQLLKDIKDAFIKVSKPKYNLTDEKCEEIINPILKYLEDASRYAFSWNHSDAYSYIGYACGYLRYYYPVEFVTACLNVWQDNQEKTAEIKKYANANNIKIHEAKFRNSRSDYFFDKENKCIYKGMKSIKFLNKKSSDELYEFRNRDYQSFIDVLYDIEDTSINSRQLDVLIKLDFFSEFGNSKELLEIYKVFEEFKNGNAKSISKAKLENDPIKEEIVKRFSQETKSTYKILNCKGILKECEDYIKSQNIPDLSLALKAQIQNEYLGYINLSLNTNDIEIRRQLFVLNVKKLVAKRGRNAGKPWAYAITAQSIGSGITSEYLVWANIYDQNPIVENNLIYVGSIKPEVYNGKKNWYITSYNILQ